MDSKQQIWRSALLQSTATIDEAFLNLDQVAIKIAIVIDDTGKILGTVSDGDIRRGLLRGVDFKDSISLVLNNNPIVVTPTVSRDRVKRLMITKKIQQIPIVNEQNQIVGLHLWDEINTSHERSNIMVIMAGGEGTRMRPHTENCPKPMLPVADKPMLEHIIERAKESGFSHFMIAVHYLGHIVEDYFGDGSKINVHIEYVREKSPLGTAGALGLIKDQLTEPFVVTNGDVLTEVNYGKILDFHIKHQATGTMAVRLHEWHHPFGVVQTQGLDIVEFQEKPVVQMQINAGIYVLSPEALGLITANKSCDMPMLFSRMQSARERIIAYPMHEQWLDVGRPSDYEEAQNRGKTV